MVQGREIKEFTAVSQTKTLKLTLKYPHKNWECYPMSLLREAEKKLFFRNNSYTGGPPPI